MEMKKKGILDIFQVMILLFGLGIITIMATVIMGELDEGFSEFVEDSPVANKTWNEGIELSENFDMIILAGLIIFILIALLLAAVIPANPIYIPVYILVAIIAVIVSVPLSNFFEAILNSKDIVGVAIHYPMATFIFANLPVIAVALIVMMMIVTYVKGGMSNER